jgi:hypothetical protein
MFIGAYDHFDGEIKRENCVNISRRLYMWGYHKKEAVISQLRGKMCN